MKNGRDIVSDHAALRYLERVYGVDIKSLKRRLALQTHAAREAGASSVTVDGVRFFLSPKREVTTVTGISQPLTNRGKRWRRRHR